MEEVLGLKVNKISVLRGGTMIGNTTIKVTTGQSKYVKQEPYIGEDGIYFPCKEYVYEGCASTYRCVLTKEMFVEAYNKWIKDK